MCLSAHTRSSCWKKIQRKWKIVHRHLASAESAHRFADSDFNCERSECGRLTPASLLCARSDERANSKSDARVHCLSARRQLHSCCAPQPHTHIIHSHVAKLAHILHSLGELGDSRNTLQIEGNYRSDRKFKGPRIRLLWLATDLIEIFVLELLPHL